MTVSLADRRGGPDHEHDQQEAADDLQARADPHPRRHRRRRGASRCRRRRDDVERDRIGRTADDHAGDLQDAVTDTGEGAQRKQLSI
jgi:hypothetical protein